MLSSLCFGYRSESRGFHKFTIELPYKSTEPSLDLNMSLFF